MALTIKNTSFLSFILALAVFFVFSSSPILASDNIFGLHLTQTADINSASKIINSSGGDWGWVTIVIRLDQMDRQTWDDFFDNCRKNHITPIVRLGTIMENGYWKIPDNADIDHLVSFLNSLTWPQKKQYVILFNEINHADEWGGGVDIKKYTDSAIYASDKFKQANSNFVILGSALDLASPDKPPQFKSAPSVYREIHDYKPEYFNKIDGLASHSYPNHGYIGTPNESGQHSVRGYEWELNFLKSLGVNKDYPIFITETGWPHREGEDRRNNFYTVATSAKFLLTSLQNWSKDDRVKAVTPFIYNYPNAPFDHFSWLDKNESLYPQYQQVVDLEKKPNRVEQSTAYQFVDINLPLILFTNREYFGEITLKNTGQSIWGETKFCLNPQTSSNIVADAICTQDHYVMPGDSETFSFKFKVTQDVKDKTYLGWESLPPTEVAPFVPRGVLYSPKNNLQDKVLNYLYNLFI